MPSISKAQGRFFQGCLHNPRHMKGRCPSPKVAREFASGSTRGLPEHVKTSKFRKLS